MITIDCPLCAGEATTDETLRHDLRRLRRDGRHRAGSRADARRRLSYGGVAGMTVARRNAHRHECQRQDDQADAHHAIVVEPLLR